jgi:PEGA domain
MSRTLGVSLLLGSLLGVPAFGQQAAHGPAFAPAAQPSSITVDANVPDCEVQIDGASMGITPLTRTLAPGKHQIVVRKAGLPDWSRSMTLPMGTVRVHATMAGLASATGTATFTPVVFTSSAAGAGEQAGAESSGGEAAGAEQPLAKRAVAAASGLTIEASVRNCDIEVDGNFAGSTPSTLELARGQHEVVVKKSGYRDWRRLINVTGDPVRLSAEMMPVP